MKISILSVLVALALTSCATTSTEGSKEPVVLWRSNPTPVPPPLPVPDMAAAKEILVMKQNLAALTSQQAEQASTISFAEGGLAENRKTIQHLLRNGIKAKEIIAYLENQNAGLESVANQIRQENGSLKARIETLSELVNALASENRTLKTEIDSLKDQINSLWLENESLRENVKVLTARVNYLEGILNEQVRR